MAISGRSVRISRNGSNIVGARTDSVTINNEPLDITDRDDAGWRTLLATPGVRSIEATASGISSDQVLLAEMMKSSITGEPLTIQLPTTTGTLAGTFLVSSFEQSAEHEGAVEFSATFMSSGVVTYTAGV